MKLFNFFTKEKNIFQKRRARRIYSGFERPGNFMAGIFVNITAAMIASAFFITGVYSENVNDDIRPTMRYIEYSSRHTVIPCGIPFGIKMLTSGVVVTDFGAVNGRISQLSPAQAAGIKKGDVITAVNGIDVNDSIALSEAVQVNPVGCEISVIRDGKKLTFTADALINDSDGEYKLGMWTRDSAAGIGTMTYYDPKTGVFAGLGHGVSDSATGMVIPLSSGEITAVTITDVIRGSSGSPGELCGAFISNTEIGTLTLNSEYGVFGECDTVPVLNEPMPIAEKSEVEKGKAVIYTTTGGMMPNEYEIEIVSIDRYSDSPLKNMTVRITDERLLSKTGGIVQGMSGSPIIQNGKLVGAVTHVLVSDSEMGYAVFAENMANAYENGIS